VSVLELATGKLTCLLPRESREEFRGAEFTASGGTQVILHYLKTSVTLRQSVNGSWEKAGTEPDLQRQWAVARFAVEVQQSLNQPPVLVAIGERKQLKRFVVCTGGKEFTERAVQFTGRLAAAVGASVTLLHVMAEPPAMYADLVRMEENVHQLLQSKSELGTNLRRQKRELERLGVSAEVHLRHGIVIDEVFEEVREGDYDLIVTGTSQARGLLRHYIMGDLTRSILNRANVPVLVARAGPPKPSRTLWKAIKGLFGRS